jgi:hypothetical protein
MRYFFVWLVDRVCLECGEVMCSEGGEGNDFIKVCTIHNCIFLCSSYILQ